MRRSNWVIALATVAMVVVALAAPALGGKPGPKPITIQSGELLASDGSVITVGFDRWGYNYQGRLFNGLYCDAYRDAAWCQDYKDDSVHIPFILQRRR